MAYNEELKRLRAQQEWGKWNTAPLANKIYGRCPGHVLNKLWDYAVLTAGYSLVGLNLYLIMKWMIL